MPAQWSLLETAVAVYFVSRGSGHEGCRRILAFKYPGQLEPRSMLAIRGKLDQIRKIPGLWKDVGGWDRTAVDAWLVGLGIHNLEAMVRVGKAEIDMVPQVIDTDIIFRGAKCLPTG